MANIDEIQLHFNPASLQFLNIILAIVMFGVALDIKVEDFKRIFKNPKAPIIGLVCQFVLLPALAFGIIKLMNPLPSVGLGLLLVASCPGGNLSNFLTSLSKGNTALSVSMSSISTMFSIIMTPFNLTFWGGMDTQMSNLLKVIHIDQFAIFKTIFLILVFPTILGMAIRHFYPARALKLKKFFNVLSIIVFLIFVGVALKINFEHFKNYVGVAFWIVLFTNASALFLGGFLSWAFGLKTKDIKAITFEVGIQNSGFGLLLIFGFFGGLGGMAVIAAWWGIWHVFSGLGLATIINAIESNTNKEDEILLEI